MLSRGGVAPKKRWHRLYGLQYIEARKHVLNLCICGLWATTNARSILPARPLEGDPKEELRRAPSEENDKRNLEVQLPTNPFASSSENFLKNNGGDASEVKANAWTHSGAFFKYPTSNKPVSA
eukprot:CAMPEP_0169164260 /NCGR_PEP_ID=MMETSP1015-20121227/58737_1 /TAXON_ID=342587 /ORGANISM="Karlodinium micrum, Strain CCMP2283" /LENGTH=122 /DNA_ID=CAMNT_0009236679 /DNA_START=202 /DNA_END=569 /DNA_ORIENTATION=+